MIIVPLSQCAYLLTRSTTKHESLALLEAFRVIHHADGGELPRIQVPVQHGTASTAVSIPIPTSHTHADSRYDDVLGGIQS